MSWIAAIWLFMGMLVGVHHGADGWRSDLPAHIVLGLIAWPILILHLVYREIRSPKTRSKIGDPIIKGDETMTWKEFNKQHDEWAKEQAKGQHVVRIEFIASDMTQEEAKDEVMSSIEDVDAVINDTEVYRLYEPRFKDD